MARAEAVLNLRIFIQATGLTKTMRFSGDMSVHECCKDIKEKANITQPTRDHGLFCPPDPANFKKGYWLAPNRALRFYGILSNQTLEFKKRHRPLKLLLVDGTQKMVVIDDGGKVRDIADSIGARIGIKTGVEEFSLRYPHVLPTDPNVPIPKHKWLKENQTLHDHDIGPDEVLEYAKKYFFFDDSIDNSDPFALQLLYTECTKGISEGRYPCTKADVRDFAALQMQVTYKDHNPQRHVVGFIDKSQFLPPSMRKDKKLEEGILLAHKKMTGLSEAQAKLRYVQLVRSLKTYGFTYFHGFIKDAKGKQFPLMMGVSKNGCNKVDPDSMKELKFYKYSDIKRWVAEKGYLQFDFGAAEEAYLQFHTPDATDIASLLAGYVDIILRMRADKGKKVGDEEDNVAEEQSMQGVQGVANFGMVASFTNPYGQGAGQGANYFPGSHSSEMGQPGDAGSITDPDGPQNQQTSSASLPPQSSRINVVDLASALKATRLLAAELGAKKLKLGMPGQLSEQDWRKQFQRHQTGLDEKVDHLQQSAKLGPSSLKQNDLDNAAKEIYTELRAMAVSASCLNDLDPENLPLLDNAKTAADTIADLLEVLLKAVDKPNTPEYNQALAAVAKCWDNSKLLSANPQLCNYIDEGAKLLLLSCLDDINHHMNGMGDLIKGTLPGLPNANSPLLQEVDKMNVIKAIALKNLANLAPVALSGEVPMQAIALTSVLKDAKGQLVGKAQQNGFPVGQMPQLVELGALVDTALANLRECLNTCERRGINGNLDIFTPVNDMLTSLANLRNNLQDPEQLIQGITETAEAHNYLLPAAKQVAFGVPEAAPRLQCSAENVTSFLKELMDHSRILLKNPGNLDSVGKCLIDIGKLESQAQELIADAGTTTALHNLRFAAKATTAAAMQLASISNAAANSNPSVRADLLASAKSVQQSLTDLLKALQTAANDPTNFEKQADLSYAAQTSVPTFGLLSDMARGCASRGLTDPNQVTGLTNAANELDVNLDLLNKAVHAVNDIAGQGDIEAALGEFDAAKHDLETAAFFASQGLLRPRPGQKREDAETEFARCVEEAREAGKELYTAPKSGTLAAAVSQAAVGITALAGASRTIASTLHDRNAQKRIIGAAQELLDDALSMISMGRSLTLDPHSAEKSQKLDKARRKFNATLGNLNEHGSAVDLRDVNNLLETINRERGLLTKNSPNRMTFKDASDQLETNAKALNATMAQFMAVAKSNPGYLPSATKMAGAAFMTLMESCSAGATAAGSSKTADDILAAARAIADALAGVLKAAKAVATTKTPQTLLELTNQQTKLKAATEALAQSLGHKISPEVEKAMQKLLTGIELLDSKSLQATASTRDNLLSEFLATSKELSRSIAGLASSIHASENSHGLFANETASLAKDLMVASQSASLSNGKEATLSLETARLIKAIDRIVQSPSDTPKVASNIKKINAGAQKLLNLAKEQAKNEQPAQKQAILRATQNAIAATNALQAAQRAANPSQPQTITALASAAAALKENVIALDEALYGGKSAEEIRVEPSVAHALVAASRNVALATHEMLRTSAECAAHSQNKAAQDEMGNAKDTVSQSIKEFLKVAGGLNLGVKECENVIREIQKNSPILESAIIQSSLGQLSGEAKPGVSFADQQTASSVVTKKLLGDLKEVFAAANSQSSHDLMKAASKLKSDIQPFVPQTKATAAASSDRQVQQKILEATKEVNNAFIRALEGAKDFNINDAQSVAKLENSSKDCEAKLGDLLNLMQSSKQLQEELTKIAAAIAASASPLGQNLRRISVAPGAPSYGNHRENLIANAHEILYTSSNLGNIDSKNYGQIGVLASHLQETLPALIRAVLGCATTTKDNDVRNELVKLAKDLVGRLVGLVKASQENTLTHDKDGQVKDASNAAIESVNALLASAKKGAVGEMMIEKACESINKDIQQLTAAGIWSQAGQLEENKSLSTKSQAELQAMVNNVSGALAEAGNRVFQTNRGQTEEDLGMRAEALSKVVNNFAKVAIGVSSCIPDSNIQQEVLSCAKLLAISNNQLVVSARSAITSVDDKIAKQTMNATHQSIQAQIENLTSVLNDLGSESERGLAALNQAIEAIQRLLRGVKGYAKAEAADVLATCKEVLKACAKLVFAPNTAEASTACTEVVSAYDKLLNESQTFAKTAPNQNIAHGLTTAATQSATVMIKVLEAAKLVASARADPKSQKQLETTSEQVTASINAIILALRRFPGEQDLALTEKGTDLDSLAEQEMNKCAELIANAAQLLEKLKFDRDSQLPEYLKNVNTGIFDAATAIARAVAMLVKASAVAQRERKENQKAAQGAKYHADPMWTDGLISAAQEVSACIQELVKAAQDCAAGQGQEELLVATARMVNQATAHLVSASRAKADPNAQSQRDLGTAAKAVAGASNSLVKSAAALGKLNAVEEEEEDFSKLTGVQQQRRAHNINNRMLEIEMQIKAEQQRLFELRKQKYDK